MPQFNAMPDDAASARRCWRWACLFAIGACCAIAIDKALAHWFVVGNTPDWIRKWCGLGEVFGHGLGVPFFLVAVGLLDPQSRRAIVRVGSMAFGAGLTANVFKLAIARYRPHKFDFAHSVFDSFSGWLPLGSVGSTQQSFPSSHTATAVGLAIGLTWLYPRARWLFAVLVVFVAAQRMINGYHFLSDTLFGTSVGLAFSGCCLHPKFLGGRFSRYEKAACVACKGANNAGEPKSSSARAA